MDEPYKDRRARGEMICVRCGCFSSARTCYQCGIGIVITCGSCADLRDALAAAIAERDALREENEALAYELKCFHDGNDGDDVHYCGKCDDHVASAEEIRENISRRRADAAKGGKG